MKTLYSLIAIAVALLVVLAALPALDGSRLEAAGPPGDGPKSEREKLHESVRPVFEVEGVVFSRPLPGQDRVEIGVERPELAAQVARKLDEVGVPRSKVNVVVTKPVVPVTSLTDKSRPLQGGLQIAFSNYLCTFGFNATLNGTVGFVLNSHCTNTYFGVGRGTTHYQNLVSAGNQIGTEWLDPSGFKGAKCPKGKVCRYSDTAFDRLASVGGAPVPTAFGSIAQPDGLGSLNFSSSFSIAADAVTITGADTAVAGETVNKVGRTTGWSQGPIQATCVDTAVSGTNKLLLCQNWVNAAVKGGDSGSPVFKIISGNNVTLYGILWGGTTDNATFVYSPISNIKKAGELGPIATH